MDKEAESWFGKIWDAIVDFFLRKDANTDMSNLERTIICVLAIVIGVIVIKIIIAIMKKMAGINKKKGPQIDTSAKSFMISVVKIILYISLALLAVSILGINIGSITGILSAIAVALGLALQDIIADFAGGVILLNQKHFLTGDYIKIDDGKGSPVEGNVERINLLITSLKTYDGQRITVPNSCITKAHVTNFTRYPNRRIMLTVDVDYNADTDLAKKLLEEIVNKDKRICLDPKPSIHISELGAYSIKIAIKAWVPYKEYWDIYNGLHEQILFAFRENNIYIPSSTDIHIK